MTETEKLRLAFSVLNERVAGFARAGVERIVTLPVDEAGNILDVIEGAMVALATETAKREQAELRLSAASEAVHSGTKRIHELVDQVLDERQKREQAEADVRRIDLLQQWAVAGDEEAEAIKNWYWHRSDSVTLRDVIEEISKGSP